MGFLRAQQLLYKVASSHQQKVERFSRREIIEKINEIKYLSSQKKVPKLTLRKEIMHLESQLGSIFEIEKALLQQKQNESMKIAGLKRQIGQLKKELSIVRDQEFKQKVEKLSYLVGDLLAKSEAEAAIQSQTAAERPSVDLASVRKQLQQLKSKLTDNSELTRRSPEKVNAILERLLELEERLNRKQPSEEQPVSQVTTVYHKIILPHQVDAKNAKQKATQEQMEIASELPLPPPPKVK